MVDTTYAVMRTGRKPAEMAGRIFGKMTVIERFGLNKHGHVLWLCRCECGGMSTPTGGDLRSGNTTSCGCGNKTAGLRNAIDITNQTYWHLTAISRAENNSRGRTQWHSRCECGSMLIVPTTSLRTGNIKSCGCRGRGFDSLRLKNLMGKAFEMLTVIGYGELLISSRDLTWLCRCECGKELYVRGKNLRKGNTRSCGCLREAFYEANSLHLEGLRNGRLLVLSRAGQTKHNGILWKCLCDCGNHAIILGATLKSGCTVSCGCARTNRDPSLRSEKWKMVGTIHAHRRRAQKLATGGTFSAEDVADRYKWQRGRCALPHCRVRLHNTFDVDHIVALSPRHRNGVQLPNLNDRRNTQLTCEPCNASKSDKDPMVHNRANGFLL